MLANHATKPKAISVRNIRVKISNHFYDAIKTRAATRKQHNILATHVSTTQSAGIYNGQVQYAMVHPSSAPAPEKPTM